MKKALSTHAACAKAIRLELKEAFPDISFSVKSDSYSGGNSVRVSWTNGPTTNQVKSITDKYQYGSFDGMRDLYEYTNTRKDLPQVKYVFEEREIQEGTKEFCFEFLRKWYAGFDTVKTIHESSALLMEKWGVCNASEYIYRKLREIDLTKGLRLDEESGEMQAM